MAYVKIEVPSGGVIIPTGKSLTFLEARQLARDLEGRLPSNAELDSIMVGNYGWKHLMEDPPKIHSLWTSTFLIYPEENSRFTNGKDIVSAYKDDQGRKWTVPWSSVEDIASLLQRDNRAIVIEDPEITIEKKQVIVEMPSIEKVRVIAPSSEGEVDDEMRLPTAKRSGVDGKIDSEQRRYLYRADGVNVSPLARETDYFHDMTLGRSISATFQYRAPLDVTVFFSDKDAELDLSKL